MCTDRYIPKPMSWQSGTCSAFEFQKKLCGDESGDYYHCYSSTIQWNGCWQKIWKMLKFIVSIWHSTGYGHVWRVVWVYLCGTNVLTAEWFSYRTSLVEMEVGHEQIRIVHTKWPLIYVEVTMNFTRTNNSIGTLSTHTHIHYLVR